VGGRRWLLKEKEFAEKVFESVTFRRVTHQSADVKV
jgi:hypothetical protein